MIGSDCEYNTRCLNSNRCIMCNDLRLLKLPTDKKRMASQSKAVRKTSTKDTREDSKESWELLEETVAAKLNAIPTTKQYEANRQVRSGAIWFMPGDVIDTLILAECKERSTITTTGEKTISIQRSWLRKVMNEANLVGKYPCLMFRYKDDEDIYCINNFNVICDMVTEMKYLREENERIRNENKVLKDELRKKGLL